MSIIVKSLTIQENMYKKIKKIATAKYGDQDSGAHLLVNTVIVPMLQFNFTTILY